MLAARTRGAWRRALLVYAAVVGLQACVTREPGPASPRAAPASRATASAAPEWRTGDRWSYAWTSGKDGGTKTVEVVETREIGKVPYYLVRVGVLDHLYTRDLHWAGSLLGDRVDARMSPPHPWFNWPLEAGRRWSQRGTYEERGAKRQYNDSFAVLGVEIVEVPAGRFESFKVVRQSSDGDSDEYWYSPEVRFHVRWVGRRGGVEFEERLQSYRVSPVPSPGATAPPPSRPQ